MAYRRKRFGRRPRYGRKNTFAGRVARRVARKSYRGAIRMPKRKLARVYATKTGQVAWRSARKLRGRRYGRRPMRMRRMRRY